MLFKVEGERPCSDLPRVFHHHGEVVVTIDRAAHALVIVAKLLEGHDTVGLLAVPLGHELLEHLIWGLSAVFHVGVFAGVVDLGDVLEGHASIFVHVQLFVGQSDPLFAFVVELALDKRQGEGKNVSHKQYS